MTGRMAACCFAAVLFSVLSLPCSGFPEDSLAPLFQRVAAETNVPLPLLYAIALVESKGHPFTLNIDGQAFFFAGKDEVIAAAKKALAAGKSFDSGVMQINSQWLTRFSIPLDAVFDPEANIWLGGWILSQNIRQHRQRNGDLTTAVARYHSTDTKRGNRYVRLVEAALAQQTGHFVLRPAAQQPKEKIGSVNGSVDGSGQVEAAPIVTRYHMARSANDFIRRMPKTFSREPAETPALTADAGFVRRYN